MLETPESLKSVTTKLQFIKIWKDFRKKFEFAGLYSSSHYAWRYHDGPSGIYFENTRLVLVFVISPIQHCSHLCGVLGRHSTNILHFYIGRYIILSFIQVLQSVRKKESTVHFVFMLYSPLRLFGVYVIWITLWGQLLSALRSSVSVSYNVGPLSTDSLSFDLPGNVFILPSFFER